MAYQNEFEQVDFEVFNIIYCSMDKPSMMMCLEDMGSMMNRVLININPSKCIICKFLRTIILISYYAYITGHATSVCLMFYLFI